MKPDHINEIIALTIRARKQGLNFNPLMVGPPGIGKTEIILQSAKAAGLETRVLNLASFDPPDFKGFPITQLINGRQRLSFAAPDFWPDGGEGMIILEEMNRAPTSIMQCLLSLGDIRRGFDDYKLPEGWIIVGSVNPENSEYDVNNMDPALKDRFEIFNVEYDKKTFVKFMEESNWSKEIQAFVKSDVWKYLTPEQVKGTAANGAKYVAPRTLSKLEAAMTSGMPDGKTLQKIIYSSILGDNVGKDFYAFLHDESPVYMSDILDKQEAAIAKLKRFSDPANLQNGLLSITIDDIIANSDKVTDELLYEVLRSLPSDLGGRLLNELGYKNGDQKITLRLFSKYKKLHEMFAATLGLNKDDKVAKKDTTKAAA